MAITCPNCSAELPNDAVFCDQCGASLSSQAPAPPAQAAAPAAGGEDTCPQCSAPTIPGEAFCDYCGASLAAPAVVAAPELEAERDDVEAGTTSQAEPAPEPVAPAASDLARCPACGEENLPGSQFCSNCGITLQPTAASAAVAEPAPADEPPPPSGKRRFVVRDTGAEIPLPDAEGDYIIGREDPVSGVFPEVDMNPFQGEDYGVSRRHAQLTLDAGLAFIQDLDSTNFTFVNRNKLAPHTPTALSNGDEVRLGKLVMTYLE